jgi:stage II sporulation protein AA (anti-sigma F factor antagonist)
MQAKLYNKNLVVKIIGDLDHHVVNNLKEKIEQNYKHSNAQNIIFDFSDVKFMDSSGIGLIIGRYKFLKGMGSELAIANIKDELKPIIEISGLEKIIKFYSNIDEALKDLK